jgi:cardiolipin synthase
MKATIALGSTEFMQLLEADLSRARRYAYAQMLTFEADSAGRRFARMFQASPAADKRLVVDDYIRAMISDRFLYSPRNLLDRTLQREARETRDLLRDLHLDAIRVKRTNPLGFLLSRLPLRNHKKLFLIDDRIAYVGGINVSDHNFAWHDMMLRIEDESITRFLREDFESTWDGASRDGYRHFGSAEVLLFDGANNEERFDRIFDLMGDAAERIWIESPYLSFPFFDRLRAATGRGVRVDVVSPGRNNKPLFDRYTTWETQRSGIRLWHLPAPMTHMKAMLIDDRHLVIGSANFDYLSFRAQQEVAVVVSDPTVIAEFERRIVKPDMARAVEWRPAKARSSGALPYFVLRLLGGTWTNALKVLGAPG